MIPAGTRASGAVTGVKGKRILGFGGNLAVKLDYVELANGDSFQSGQFCTSGRVAEVHQQH